MTMKTTITFDLDPIVFDGPFDDPVCFKHVLMPQFDPELACWLSVMPSQAFQVDFLANEFLELYLTDMDIVDLNDYDSAFVTPCTKRGKSKTTERPAPYSKSGTATKSRSRDRVKQRGHEDNYRKRCQSQRDTLVMTWISAEKDLQQALTCKIAASQDTSKPLALCERVRLLVQEERAIKVDTAAMKSVLAWDYLLQCKQTKETVSILSEHKTMYAFDWS